MSNRRINDFTHTRNGMKSHHMPHKENSEQQNVTQMPTQCKSVRVTLCSDGEHITHGYAATKRMYIAYTLRHRCDEREQLFTKRCCLQCFDTMILTDIFTINGILRRAMLTFLQCRYVQPTYENWYFASRHRLYSLKRLYNRWRIVWTTVFG